MLFAISQNQKCICMKIETTAMPKNSPVIKRNGLLLNHFVFHCNTPSTTRGNVSTIHQPLLAYQPVKTNNIASNIIATASPVQRAQMGNCFPFQ